MSSILEALRKLEQERARKRDAAPAIAADILRNDVRRRELPLWLWPTTVAATVLLLALAVWSFLSPPVAPVGAERSTPPPTAAPPVASPPAGGGVIIEEVIDSRRPLTRPQAQPLPTGAPPVAVRQDPPVQVTETAVVPPPVPPVVAASPAEAPPHGLTVTEIVWQEERSARMAVVNGLPVMEGDEAGEARVEEIAPDRVLFSRGNAQYSVKLSR